MVDWFDRAVNAVGSFISTVARATTNFVRDAYHSAVSGINTAVQAGKWLAKRAIDAAKAALVKAAVAIADHGHNFVDSVKRTWNAVKPHLQAVARPVLAFLKHVSRGHPKLNAFVVLVDRVIDFALKYLVGPVAAAIEAAVRWTIDMIARVVDRYLRPDEWAEARRHRDFLRKTAAEIMKSHPEEAQAMLVSAMFIDFELARAGVAAALEEDSFNDFDQFLRLRAAQRLLEMAEHRLTIADDLTVLTEADYLIVELCSAMLEKGAVLDEQKLALLDGIVEKSEGRKLLPFVFETLLVAWAARLTALARLHKIEREKVKTLRKRLAMLKPKLRSGMSAREEAEWAVLPDQLEMTRNLADAALSRAESMERYVHAAEGYLNQLEKSSTEFSETIDDIRSITAQEIAPLLIWCAENEIDWNKLEPEKQNKIARFAMLYEEDFKARMLLIESGKRGKSGQGDASSVVRPDTEEKNINTLDDPDRIPER